MVEWIEKLAPVLWHGLLIAAALIAFLNIQRTKDGNWLWIGVGFAVIEASLLFRGFGPGHTIEGGSWTLAPDSSIFAFLVDELGIVCGALAIAIGLFLVGRKHGV